MILRINKYVVFCIALIVLASCAKDNKVSSDQSNQFIKYFGGSEVDEALAVVECSDGGFALTGTMSIGNTKTKAFLIRTDKFGNELKWSQVLFGDTLQSTGNSIIALPDGGFLVVGSSNVVTNNILNSDVLVAKFGNNGSIAWQKKIGGGSNDEAFCAIQTGDGGFVIGGYTESSGKGGKDAWAMKLDINGNTIWNQTQGGSKDDIYKSIVETDNNFILVGSTESWLSGGFDRSVFFVKIDKSTGDPTDFAFYGGLSKDSKIDVIKDDANNLIVMRNILNGKVSNIELLKVEGDFHQFLWDKNISTGNETGSSLFILNNQIEIVGNSTSKFLLRTVSLEDGGISSSTVEPGIANQLVTDGIVSSDGHAVIVGSNSIDNYSKISLRKIK